MKSNALSILLASLILGGSVVAAGVLVRDSVDRGTAELASVRVALADLEAAAKSGAPAPAPRATRPDPKQRYTVNTAGSPALGPASAQVTLVEFSDFQCPFCSRVIPTIKKIEQEYGDRVRIVFKHLPLSMHAKAPAAHAAAEAAHRQGSFWEMHDRIFANQQEMSPEKYVEYAAEIGLDVEQFQEDVAAADVKQRVEADSREAARLLVRGTPGFFVNGRFLSGAQPYEAFKRLIDEELGQG